MVTIPDNILRLVKSRRILLTPMNSQLDNAQRVLSGTTGQTRRARDQSKTDQ